jgi:hypothetical protein
MLETSHTDLRFEGKNRGNRCFEARITGQTGLEIWDSGAKNPVLRWLYTGYPQSVEGFSTGFLQSMIIH